MNWQQPVLISRSVKCLEIERKAVFMARHRAKRNRLASFDDVTRFAACDYPINGKQGNCSDYRGNKASGFSIGVPVHGTSDKVSKECARDTKQRGNDESAGIFARHESFCDESNNQADE